MVRPAALHTAPAPAAAGPDRRSTAVLLAFALANTGGVLGYLPLLTLLLPIKVEAVAGPARLGVLTACALAGAVASSLSNILFGWLSDRSLALGRGRRGWLAGGLVATIASFAGIVMAATPAAIVMTVVAFQVAVNAILAPFSAAMAEEIPDAQKGIASGLLALGAPLASTVSAGVVVAASGEGARFALLSAAMALCLAPMLAIRAERVPDAGVATGAAVLRRDLAVAWTARLLLQVASIVLGLYLLYYLEGMAARPPTELAGLVAQLQAAATIAAAPLAVLAGSLSDRIGQRKPFLIAAATFAAVGLLAMAEATSWQLAAAGFCLHAIGTAIFIALHSGFAMQLLPDPAHRGRDLGLYNLTNTLPSLLGPALTWWLAAPGNYHGVLLVLGLMTLTGGVLMLAVRARD